MKYLILFLLTFSSVKAQELLPYVFENNSEYADSEIYIGLVGKYSTTGDVWMDMTTSTLVAMSEDDNTVSGPSWSTPTTWLYPDIFTKLSDITDKTIQIPQGLYACRIFISFQSPMYFHFHSTGGYAGANLASSTDPNDGIRWELIELTWGDSGLWTNTSRVDAYQYPMALEVTGFTGSLTGSTYSESYSNAINGSGTASFGKVGELLSHDEIISNWDGNVSSDYLVCKITKTHSLDGEPIIEQPSKIDTFPDTIFDTYITEIWDTYTNNDLVINIGDRGTWTGRVTGEQFDFTDPVDGTIASIYSKPSTTDAIECSGALAYTSVDSSEDVDKYNEDLMIQAQIAAAINRHAIYTDEVGPTIQYSHDATRFFQIEPYNEYVSYFHDDETSYDSKTYAFAYDDVGDQSSTIQCTFPTGVKVIIGGYSTNNSLSVSAVEKTENIIAYPNPTNGENVYLTGDIENSTISLFAINGSLIKEQSIENESTTTVTTDGLAKGIYLLKVKKTNSDASSTFKVSVN